MCGRYYIGDYVSEKLEDITSGKGNQPDQDWGCISFPGGRRISKRRRWSADENDVLGISAEPWQGTFD